MRTKETLIQMCLLLAALLLQVANCGAQTVIKVAGGGNHTLFLLSDGSLWGMGYNADGELGDGTYRNTNRPERIVTTNVTAIAAGGAHSLFLKNDGSLWAMGDDSVGQLGDGNVDFDYYNTNRPERIVVTNVTAIAAGNAHSLFLKSDGSLWAMGGNDSGQLGDGPISDGYYMPSPEKIVTNGVMAIAAGSFHSLFVKTNGSLWAMGYNSNGQLGDGTYNRTNRPEQIAATNITAITAAGYYSIFIKTNGTLWAVGDNSYGQLGDGSYNRTNRPEQIVTTNVTAIAARGDHSLFLKSDGSLWGMGANQYGQLGDGTFNTTNRAEQILPIPPPPTDPFTAALDAPGLVWTNNGMWTVGSSSDAHDGVSCAVEWITLYTSSFLETSLQTTIMGPAQVSYWWKINRIVEGIPGPTNNSILPIDYLSLSVDGQWVSQIIGNTSGNDWWEQRTVFLSSGSHNLQWIHTMMNNSPGYSFTSEAYLDQVVVTPVNAPLITVQPQSQRVFPGTNGTFTAEVIGATPLFYQWQLNSTNLPGATSLSLTITNVQLQNGGAYSLVASNSYSSATSSNAMLTVLWFSPVLVAQSASPTNFGFNLTGSSNLVIVVEACTNLSNHAWQAVQTNTLTGGATYFSDPQWTNYPGRFYRLRSP